MASAQDLLDAEETEQARLDILAEKMKQPALELIDELLHDPTNRDAELWEAAGVADIEVTIDDYENVPVDERDSNWLMGIAAMTAAAKLQAFAEDRAGTLSAYARRLRNVNGLDLSEEELIEAATKGVSKANIKALTLQMSEEPTVEDQGGEVLEDESITSLRDMSNADFIDTLQDSRMIPTWESQQSKAMFQASKMFDDPPGGDSFTTDKSSLIDEAAGIGILLLLRRSSQQYATLSEVDGKEDTLMIWVTEDDKKVCENCDPRGGQIDTYIGWVGRGLPGSSICLGKDRCRCDLFKIPGNVGQMGEVRGRVISEAKAERAATRLVKRAV